MHLKRKKEIQISKIARYINRQSSEVLFYLKSIGIVVGSVMSKVDVKTYHKIIRHFKLNVEESDEHNQKLTALQQRRHSIEVFKKDKIKKSYKSHKVEFLNVIKKTGIKTLYHFIDEENIESIKTYGGLYSWYACLNKGIVIKKQASNDISRALDTKKGLENYVRLSFNSNQPMLYVAKKAKKIKNVKILEIDIDVILWNNTLFSDVNATANGAQVGGDLDDFLKIDFKIALSEEWMPNEKSRYQAEVLVEEHIPIEFIKIN